MVSQKLTALAASLAGVAVAHPAGQGITAGITKRQNIDVTVLQFALTLEHLENAFYKEALTKLSSEDFVAGGYGADYRDLLKYIAADESSHVEQLSAALSAAGATPVEPCTYNFPYEDA